MSLLDKTNYFYLISSLPDLDPYFQQKAFRFDPSDPQNKKEGDTIEQLDTQIEFIFETLSQPDADTAAYLLYPIDNINLANMIWQEERKNLPGWGGPFVEAPFIDGGRFDKDTLYKEIRQPDEIPSYMKDFLEERSRPDMVFERASLLPIDQLSRRFYKELEQHSSPFLRQWFAFDSSLRNLIAASRARKRDIPLQRRRAPRVGESHAQTLQENETAETIFSSHAHDYGLSAIYPWAAPLFELDAAPLQEGEIGIDRIRWRSAAELSQTLNPGAADFTLDHILAYIIQAQTVRRWHNLERQKSEDHYSKISEALLKQAFEKTGAA